MTSETENGSIVLAFGCRLQIIAGTGSEYEKVDDVSIVCIVDTEKRKIIVIFNDLTNGLRLIGFFHWRAFRLSVYVFFHTHRWLCLAANDNFFFQHCDGNLRMMVFSPARVLSMADGLRFNSLGQSLHNVIKIIIMQVSLRSNFSAFDYVRSHECGTVERIFNIGYRCDCRI